MLRRGVSNSWRVTAQLGIRWTSSELWKRREHRDDDVRKRRSSLRVGTTHIVVKGGQGRSGVVCYGCGAMIERTSGGVNTVSGSFEGLKLHRLGLKADAPLEDMDECERCRLIKAGDLLGALKATAEMDPAVFINQLRALRLQYMVAVMVVDAMDYDATFIPFVREFVGESNPIILAITKTDLLCDPRDSMQKERLRNYFQERAAVARIKPLDAVPVSGKSLSTKRRGKKQRADVACFCRL